MSRLTEPVQIDEILNPALNNMVMIIEMDGQHRLLLQGAFNQ
jgi:hypothetical protein